MIAVLPRATAEPRAAVFPECPALLRSPAVDACMARRDRELISLQLGSSENGVNGRNVVSRPTTFSRPVSLGCDGLHVRSRPTRAPGETASPRKEARGPSRDTHVSSVDPVVASIAHPLGCARPLDPIGMTWVMVMVMILMITMIMMMMLGALARAGVMLSGRTPTRHAPPPPSPTPQDLASRSRRLFRER